MLPFAVLFVAWFFPFAPELRVRIAGFLVTLFGVVLVVKEILDRQRFFDLTRTRGRILAWLKRFPAIFLRPKAQTVHLGTITSTLNVGGLQIRAEAGSHTTLEERVIVLEQKLQQADKQITEVETKLTSELRKLQSEADAERRNREEHDQALRKQVEHLSVGGVDFELMGVAWVIWGSAFATFPGEIAYLLR